MVGLKNYMTIFLTDEQYIPKMLQALQEMLLNLSLIHIFGVVMFVPLLYMLLQSLKPMEEIFIFPPRFWVNRPTPVSYTHLDVYKRQSSRWDRCR